MMASWDFIIVGAGSAGCVLAERLSENPANRVLLIEAGPVDSHPLIHMPKGFGRILGNPKYCWHYPVDAAGASAAETWIRGKVLGGSSSVNGMMYTNAHPSDYDEWADAGLTGWGWEAIGACFDEIESCNDDDQRPLRITTPAIGYDRACDAIIKAGQELGLPLSTTRDSLGNEGIGYFPRTIHKGRRWSAARAFLKTAGKRRNLKVLTDARVLRITFDGRSANGVLCAMQDGSIQRISGRETILSAGTLESPRILQLSGVGPARLLSDLNIPIVHGSENVGRNMREHRLLTIQHRLQGHPGLNSKLRGPGLASSVLEYYATRRGVLSSGAYDVGAFARSSNLEGRPDIQINFSPYSLDPGKGVVMERAPGMRAIAYVLRPTSLGELRISSREAGSPLDIRPNYLGTEHDRRKSVAAFRYVRRLFSTPPVSHLSAGETSPGSRVETDDEIVTAYLENGGAGFHATGTCAMGIGKEAVTDPELRVRGVSGLRVVDCSVLPTMVSGNTNGPVMAIAWNAAKLILSAAR